LRIVGQEEPTMRRSTSVRKPHAILGVLGAVLAAAAIFMVQPVSMAAEEPVEIPPPSLDELPAAGLRKAIFAGGCFWGVQGVFQHTDGVTSAVSGYAGGEQATAVYELVGSGRTGHAEAVEVTYDPNEISYGKLLQVFFSVAHNPTQLNYQGPDHGPQYRSAIFPLDANQEKVAASYIAELDAMNLFEGRIVTTLEGARPFYPAEDYHQDFMTRHPGHPYIVFHDLPKLQALRRLFPDLYREEPVLVATARRSGG
jgi:peptide-methionine (S)-S-oxide reductase